MINRALILNKLYCFDRTRPRLFGRKKGENYYNNGWRLNNLQQLSETANKTLCH